MDWKDEEVEGAYKRGMGDKATFVRAIMTYTAELLAARGGTMTVEQLTIALAEIDKLKMPEHWPRDYTADVAEHISTLGARNAVLETEKAEWEMCACDSAILASETRRTCDDELDKMRERLSAVEDGHRELVRRAQQAEALLEREQDAVRLWSKRAIAAVEERDELKAQLQEARIARDTQEKVDRGIIERLEARCATLSAAGQVLSAHVDGTLDADPRTFGDVDPPQRHPCSATCTHDDAATPGHPERVKERSEAVNAVTGAPDPVGALAVRAGAKPGREIAAYRTGYEQACDDMRAACLGSVLALCDQEGMTPGLRRMFQAAIEGAVP